MCNLKIFFQALFLYEHATDITLVWISIILFILCTIIFFKNYKSNVKSSKKIKSINLQGFLGREPIKLDYNGVSDYLKNKRILVTGAGGTIGSELCRQIIKFHPQKLLMLDIYENNIYELQTELVRTYPNLKHKLIIASIRDKERLESIFKENRPEIVFHAAAHKHVPIMESNPTEAIKNNIFGTLNLVECADKYEIEKFVLISTDKAVNPTNIMGATKRVCEMIIQAMNGKSKTQYTAVRFGNVLGSNGSVVPLFLKQIDEGGPITITNKYVTRYFMLVSEAAQLLLQAGAFAKGGEIFVLDMGKPIKIYDLAYALIKQTGYIPNKDIKLEITGLRPGEKLREELFAAEESLKETASSKIFYIEPTPVDMDSLKEALNELKNITKEENSKAAINKLSEIVPNYKKYQWKI